MLVLTHFFYHVGSVAYTNKNFKRSDLCYHEETNKTDSESYLKKIEIQL
jgi:hypothetical protein